MSNLTSLKDNNYIKYYKYVFDLMEMGKYGLLNIFPISIIEPELVFMLVISICSSDEPVG